ncbi:MAG: rod shape-determining protein RodA [Streptosporangiales bacterium]|nr:rod shape-determining protein RodA [Streptosporangiales bacterium]
MLAAVFALTVFGALLVWSATRVELLDAGSDPTSFLGKHLLNVAIGAVLMVLAALPDYRVLRAYAPVAYVLASIGLIAVLTPLGATINGSHSWIVLGGGIQFQPSEFAKIALVLGLAMMLGEPRDGEVAPRSNDIILALVAAAVMMGLIMLQPDLGTTMVFVAVILGVLAVSGADLRWLSGLLAAGVIGSLLVWQMGLLEDYQIARFTAFADPSVDPRGVGYNANQALIAIGSGGLLGKGLFNGGQTAGHFVPEQHTDFIFTVAGEELGFVGGAVLLVLLGIVLWRGLRIAMACEDPYGRLVATGVVCWLTFQTFVNIGMTIGVMPITGLPLPFVSYGGTATFAGMVAIGLLQGVRLRTRRYD